MDDFLKYLEGPSVLVKVGTGETSRDFTVPKELLCKRASWFARALEDEKFEEGRTGIVKLPEDSVSGFKAFHYYLYNRVLVWPNIELESDTAALFAEQLESVIEAWIFADKYSIHAMQDCAMYAMCVHLTRATAVETGLPAVSLAACFSRTGDSAPLRKVAADYVVTRMDEGRADASDLLRGLAGEAGFVQALHEAQVFHNNATPDTRRRYQRAGQFKELFVARTPGMARSGRLVKYVSGWMHWQTCRVCGFGVHDEELDCSQCKNLGKRCEGVCEGRCLCQGCAEPTQEYQR